MSTSSTLIIPLLKSHNLFSKLIRKPCKITTHTHVQNIPLQLWIVLEHRPNVRYALTSKRVILRLPLQITETECDRYSYQFEQWLAQTIQKQLGNAKRTIKKYTDGQTITVGTHHYTLAIKNHTSPKHTARLQGNTIHLHLNTQLTSPEILNHQTIPYLISKCVTQHQQNDFKKQVNEINKAHFQELIKDIRFKLNTSNWGSCSSNNILNFSSRLFFAPPIVQQYVIVHELAHLKEMNHSPRFWSIVSAIMPNYHDSERWLKENANLCEY